MIWKSRLNIVLRRNRAAYFQWFLPDLDPEEWLKLWNSGKQLAEIRRDDIGHSEADKAARIKLKIVTAR